jgi:hypothetical protein
MPELFIEFMLYTVFINLWKGSMSETQETINSTCPQCGTAFLCGYQADEKTCWCFQLPHIAVNDSLGCCLCPKCLLERIRQQQKGNPNENSIAAAE